MLNKDEQTEMAMAWKESLLRDFPALTSNDAEYIANELTRQYVCGARAMSDAAHDMAYEHSIVV